MSSWEGNAFITDKGRAALEELDLEISEQAKLHDAMWMLLSAIETRSFPAGALEMYHGETLRKALQLGYVEVHVDVPEYSLTPSQRNAVRTYRRVFEGKSVEPGELCRAYRFARATASTPRESIYDDDMDVDEFPTPEEFDDLPESDKRAMLRQLIQHSHAALQQNRNRFADALLATYDILSWRNYESKNGRRI